MQRAPALTLLCRQRNDVHGVVQSDLACQNRDEPLGPRRPGPPRAETARLAPLGRMLLAIAAGVVLAVPRLEVVVERRVVDQPLGEWVSVGGGEVVDPVAAREVLVESRVVEIGRYGEHAATRDTERLGKVGGNGALPLLGGRGGDD